MAPQMAESYQVLGQHRLALPFLQECPPMFVALPLGNLPKRSRRAIIEPGEGNVSSKGSEDHAGAGGALTQTRCP